MPVVKLKQDTLNEENRRFVQKPSQASRLDSGG